MIIGNGMLARAFIEYNEIEDIVIFASGVSNSRETRDEEFLREKRLLEDVISKYHNSVIVYFSTCSIYNKALSNSKYVQHKILLENLITSRCSSYRIFRLPNVVGKTTNKQTIVNYFVEKIELNNEIFVYSNSVRYLIDVEDVLRICKPLILASESIIKNILLNNKINVVEIVELLSGILDIKPKVKIIQKYDDLTIEKEELLNCDINYNYNLLNKYYNKKSNELKNKT
ncbi:NAD-dependent epimerase/dehydratase family protein [Flammeovirga sp. SR4]|uniref:NAD-dependent epimerase/dehydratase family protein n=2 Tax=Flammeovirga agarivorans TaxID=2726742 RepID=A0A7X8XWQ2_9BACT|nr:NAD-dependent epimerase/dehydratase family protein [Flammeovirga agarivorans]